MTLYRALTELSFQAKCKWQNRSRGFDTYLLTKYALRPEECFFIDDLGGEILGPPGSAGWRATFLTAIRPG